MERRRKGEGGGCVMAVGEGGGRPCSEHKFKRFKSAFKTFFRQVFNIFGLYFSSIFSNRFSVLCSACILVAIGDLYTV